VVELIWKMLRSLPATMRKVGVTQARAVDANVSGSDHVTGEPTTVPAAAFSGTVRVWSARTGASLASRTVTK
jgi:hypothetical protein